MAFKSLLALALNLGGMQAALASEFFTWSASLPLTSGYQEVDRKLLARLELRGAEQLIELLTGDINHDTYRTISLRGLTKSDPVTENDRIIQNFQIPMNEYRRVKNLFPSTN